MVFYNIIDIVVFFIVFKNAVARYLMLMLALFIFYLLLINTKI